MVGFQRVLLIGLLFGVFAWAGCSQVDGYDWRNREWAKAPRLERVQVVVLDAREEGRMAGESPVVASKAEVEKWTREALQKVPGTVVVMLGAGQTAGEGGAKMLCRVTIGEAGNSFGIGGVPALWFARARVQYDIELIDIASGELRFKAVRFVSSGGEYNVLPLTDIPTLYQRDLAHVLKFATYPVGNSEPVSAATRPAVPATSPATRVILDSHDGKVRMNVDGQTLEAKRIEYTLTTAEPGK